MILIHSIAPSSANTSRLELDDKIDQLRHVNAERDNLKDDIDVERRKAADAQRQITTLQEQIHRHDIALLSFAPRLFASRRPSPRLSVFVMMHAPPTALSSEKSSR